ncbi:MAG: tetratricopeptide repeat protein [Okeania sp. SIO3B5]|uniref:FxSxx-COOH system tetratricopeptide repeat protein n=1 Tax=Okeania sp. SIO3B5 TaxID=2607811 RepID=UPI0013FF4F26|nr:FxSxx-COOH system tetratricopeptide repeat protein [Okeania sp. SIO3B5]NEO54594.1 tetratricopeptide repeat protein [Okeania sp. SIO3B5]
MSGNTGEKKVVDINKNYGVGIGVGVNEGEIENLKIANTINENNYFDTKTKGLPRKGEPAEFPNNLKKVRTGAVKFVGRDGDLKTLHDQLQEKERVSITAVVTGMAGVGKTELALQYALLSKKELTYPGGICWIGVRERSVIEQLLDFAETQLGLFPAEGWTLEQYLDYCWSNWQPAGDVLIILDDVDKYEEIAGYLPPQEKRFKLLITTRRYWLSESFENLRLEVLDEGAALELLEVLIGESRVAEQREEAKQLCEWLGYLPLGLELVGRFLKRRSGWKLARMIGELEKQALDLPALQKRSGEMTAKRGVKAALELSWQELDERARYLGCFLSMFALAPIRWSLVEQCLSGGETQEEEFISAWEDVREDSLLDLNLIQQTAEETYQLHQLVRRYFLDKLEKMEEVDELRYQFCWGILVEAEKIPETPVKAEIEELTLSIPHLAETATEMQQSVGDEDLVWLFARLGRFYAGQGLYGLAESWHKQCLDITRSRLGVEHTDVATSINNLANLYNFQGRYTEAEPLYLEALEMRKQLLGSSHPSVATSINNLAQLYNSQGRYTEAEPLFLEALEMYKQLLGSSHPSVATSLNNLALLYNSQGRYTEAEPLYLEALEITKQLLGSSHPDVAMSLNNLASLYSNQGRYTEAEPLYLEALEMRKQLLGSSHPDVAMSLNNLAQLYYFQGQYTEAEPLYLEALEMYKQLLGSSHPDVAMSLNNLASLYSNQGQYTEAEPLYLEALEMYKQLLGSSHPDVAMSLNNLASLYFNQRRYTETEPLYLEALGMYKQLLGSSHPDVATSLNNLAQLYNSQGRYTEAEPLFLEALEITKQLLGSSHPDVARSLNNLALLYSNQRRYTEAEFLFLEALEITKQLLGEEHPNTQTVQRNYQYFLSKFSGKTDKRNYLMKEICRLYQKWRNHLEKIIGIR